jgi:hypothetical protein
LWNTTAARIDNYRPPTAQNWSFGCWSQFVGDGYWEDVNDHISPFSFFYTQLEQRLGRPVALQARLQPKDRNEVTSPTYEKAQELTVLARRPLQTLKDWIEMAKPPTGAFDYAATDSWTLKKAPASEGPYAIAEPLTVKDGKILRGERLLTGASQGIRYWNGSLNRSWTETVAPHLTRYVPGRMGHGLTDDLEAVAQGMVDHNRVVLNHNYGLWYERRRDDHERIRRADGNVWAPFYELPFARSGEGRAWDGLSKYDLTKYNPWYFDRLAQFVKVADHTGLVLENQHYHQHNIIEAGAHWADFPWRSANNINNTGFPEPVPYAGDKRIFMAEHFYDLDNPIRVALHKAYIRKNLGNFPENSGVIHSISAEYTGPEHFARFWLGEVKAWQQETGRDATIALATTKDVQDAILADPELRAVVDIIEIRFWHYRANGSLYAPPGGANMAPRQHARQVDPGESSFEQVYRAVKEYRDRYPGKAVTYYSYTYDIDVEVPSFGWAAFMAGGSMAAIPRVENPVFRKETAGMDILPAGEGQYVLGKTGVGYVIYSTTGTADITLGSDRAGYRACWIDARTGSLTPLPRTIRDGDKLKVDGTRVLWLTKSR